MSTEEQIKEIILKVIHKHDPIDWAYAVKDIMDIFYLARASQRKELREKIEERRYACCTVRCVGYGACPYCEYNKAIDEILIDLDEIHKVKGGE